ncbi:MAG: LuxR C-terminal-related transcriptional regulator [Solirubrobacteraceae bacterium]
MGRREELELLGQALDAAGINGVVLAGMAGVGKTRLARETLVVAEAKGWAPRWAAASRAAAVIPFGALAHLLPDADPADRFEVLQQAADWLVSSSNGRRPLLGVDDAHLLDDASAALIHQLAASGAVFVVATVRSGEPAPDAVTALSKDGLAERLEVQPLGRSEAAELVVAALGDQVAGITQHELWRLSQGNALYLRELVRGGLDRGQLARSDGIWRWEGPVTAAPHLLELVQTRIGELTPVQRRVLELVAFGEPLQLEILKATGTELAIVEDAEDEGLIVTETIGRQTTVRLGHPLYGEAVRERSTPLRARAVHHFLAEALATNGGGGAEDTMRLATWGLAAGNLGSPEVLLAAARRSIAAADYQLAERLARAAVASGAAFEADQMLAAALVGQGRAEEAEATLLEATPGAETDTQRASLATTRALNLHWGLDRALDAEAVVVQAQAAISDPAKRDELAVLRAKFLMYAAQRGAHEPLAAVASRAQNAGHTQLEAVVLVPLGQLLSAEGRYGDADAVAQRGLAVGSRLRGRAWSLAEDELTRAQCGAYLWSGQLAEAATLAEVRYHRSLDTRWSLNTAAWASWLAMTAGAQGTVRTALAWAREAAAMAADTARIHPYQPFTGLAVLGILARAAAMAGNADEAEAALIEADTRASPSVRLFDTWAGPPRPWSAAARGELSTAVELGLDAATQARHAGHFGFELIALHDVARFGAQERVAARVDEVAPLVEGRLSVLYADHVNALMASDGVALESVARSFAALGFRLLAAEAAAEASEAYREGCRRSSSLASAVRAREWAAACEGARTPALRRLDQPTGLTPREAEVAHLAASGLASRAVAERLVISVRTVDNTLHEVYAKLGLAGRHELAAIFGLSKPQASSSEME